MKVGIMQPYFLPYIGYWQLINAVDEFVLLDDVNYIRRGYINRNNILLNQNSYMFSIPVEKASQNRLISEMHFKFPVEEKKKFLRTIQSAYHKAPYYNQVFPVIEKIVLHEDEDLTAYIENSIHLILSYVGIERRIRRSSQIQKDNTLTGEARIIEICRCLQADTYINPCGGKELYSKAHFEERQMQLFFLNPQMEKIRYRQFGEAFVPYLSVIDILMFCNQEEILKLIEMYDLE